MTVRITDIEGSVGDELAAVMYRGLGLGDPDARVVGGFGATVDSDPASITGVIAAPSGDGEWVPFPSVSYEPLIVEPGQYTIMVWIDDRLMPYSRWVPIDADGGRELGGCRVDVTVAEARPTLVTVEGVPDWTGFGDEPVCTTG